MGRAVRITVALVLAACGGAPKQATAPAPTHPAASATPAGACSPAYAEYAQRWRVALTADLVEVSDALEPAAIEDIVVTQVATLPDREELVKLRAVYGVIELFITDAAWPVAFAAAERAIEQCGERAKRPAT